MKTLVAALLRPCVRFALIFILGITTNPNRADATTLVFAAAPDRAGGYWAVGWAQKPSPLTFKNYIVRRVP